MNRRRTLLHSAIAFSGVAALETGVFAQPASKSDLTPVVRSPRFLVNGVTSDAAGTVYVAMPRWSGMEDSPGVARVEADGSLVPFPGGHWHDWREAPAGECLLQVNAIHVFDDDLLWVVDQGAPDRRTVRPGGQKLLAFHRDGSLAHRLRFDAGILPPGATLNDVRKRGSRLFMTDSGLGAIVLHDLASGRSLRRLSRNPALRMDADHALKGQGGRILQDGAGKRPQVQSDMLEVDATGRWFYWAFPAGPLRRIPVADLWDEGLDDAVLAERIETVAEIPSIGGTAIDSLGNVYLADCEARRIAVLTPDRKLRTLVQDDRLVSPDAIWIDAQRRLLVPAPQTEYLPEHAGGRNRLEPPYLVLGLPLPAEIGGHPLGEAVYVPGRGPAGDSSQQPGRISMVNILPVRPQALAAFLPVMRANVAASREEPGNDSFDVFQGEDDSPELYLFERWKSAAALDLHMQEPHLKNVAARVGTDLARAETSYRLTELPPPGAHVRRPFPSGGSRASRNVIVRLAVRPGLEPRFLQAMAQTAVQARQAPGNHAYEVYRIQGENTGFLIFER